MLKSSKKIIPTKKSIIDGAVEWLEINDKYQDKNQKVLFDKIFIDETKYTIIELSINTNYSERSIFRIIKKFEKLIKIIGEKQEQAEEKNIKD